MVAQVHHLSAVPRDHRQVDPRQQLGKDPDGGGCAAGGHGEEPASLHMPSDRRQIFRVKLSPLIEEGMVHIGDQKALSHRRGPPGSPFWAAARRASLTPESITEKTNQKITMTRG